MHIGYRYVMVISLGVQILDDNMSMSKHQQSNDSGILCYSITSQFVSDMRHGGQVMQYSSM